MGGFNFRLGTYNVPSGSRPKHLKTRPKAEFDGMDGWMDRTEYQKCPFIFFILCMYIDKVYTYLYRGFSGKAPGGWVFFFMLGWP